MLVYGTAKAQELAMTLLGDPEAFSILYSGYSSRREKGWHVHIVLLGSRWKKAWLFVGRRRGFTLFLQARTYYRQ